jgi:death-on-curing protein
MRPRNAARYEEDADIPLQAAYLAHGIAEGQYLLDANKRTALVAMVTFLEVNGYWLTAHPEEVAGWMIDLSRGLSVYDLARRVHDNSNHHEGVWGVGEDE